MSDERRLAFRTLVGDRPESPGRAPGWVLASTDPSADIRRTAAGSHPSTENEHEVT
jgi:hypothetical protein